jgi:hypothetical protein
LEDRCGVRADLSDYKFTEAVFRTCKKDFGIPVRLTVEQFLNTGNFTLKKIEFVTDVCNFVLKRFANSSTDPLKKESPPKSFLVVEEPNEPEVPRAVVAQTKSNDQQVLDKIHDKVYRLVESLHDLECTFVTKLEDLEARMSIMEGRLRIWDQLSYTKSRE